MSTCICVIVNGKPVEIVAGASVAAAVAQAGAQFRRSRSGEARAALCGMGVCFECRVEIDGVPQQQACMLIARAGMQVRTDG